MTVVVKLSGGVGNQLFQLAFARTKTLMTDERAILDLSEVSAHADRNVLPWLDYSNDYYFLPKHIEVRSFSQNISLLNFLSGRKNNKVLVKISEVDSFNLPFFKENYRQFVYEFLLASTGYFSGTFASYHYWNKFDYDNLFNWIYQDIKTYLQFNPPREPFGVGIHARRGDYFQNPKTRSFHGYCGIEYFKEALTESHEFGYTKNGILISSDDSAFSRVLCRLAQTFTRKVEIAPIDNPYLSLMQLNHCDASIGSNSTFSYWGSYLQPKQMRIFPVNWFLSPKPQFKTSSLLLGNFVIRENELHS